MRALVFLFVMVFLCLAYDAFRAQLGPWWKHHGGGVPYVMFFIALFASLFPKRRMIPIIVALATLGTVALEFLQSVKGEPLATIRAYRLGQALLGSGFDWMDIPPYFVGGALGALVLWLVLIDEDTKSKATL